MSDPYRTAAVVEEKPKPKFRVVLKVNDEGNVCFHVERQSLKTGKWEYAALGRTEEAAIRKAQVLRQALLTPDKVVWESE